MMSHATCLALPLLLVSAPAAAAEVGVLLGQSGGGTQAAELEQALTTSLSSRGWRVMGSARLVERLAGTADLARAVQTAGAAVDASERHWLHLRRPLALSEAKRALDVLDGALGRHHAAALLARAHVAMAQAHMLQPADEQSALRSFCSALDADPGFQPQKGRFSSRVAQVLEIARAKPRRLIPPARQELETIALTLGLRLVVWVGWAGERPSLVIYDPTRHRRLGLEEVPCPGCSLADAVARGVQGLLPSTAVVERPTPQRPLTFAPRLISLQVPPTASDRPTRWYRRWWVWGLAGAVLAGVTIAVATTQLSRTERSYQLRFSGF